MPKSLYATPAWRDHLAAKIDVFELLKRWLELDLLWKIGPIGCPPYPKTNKNENNGLFTEHNQTIATTSLKYRQPALPKYSEFKPIALQTRSEFIMHIIRVITQSKQSIKTAMEPTTARIQCWPNDGSRSQPHGTLLLMFDGHVRTRVRVFLYICSRH